MKTLISKFYIVLLAMTSLLLVNCNDNTTEPEPELCIDFVSPIPNENRTQMLIPPGDLHNFRYGEVLPTFACGNTLITEIYVTMSFSNCPEDEFNALNANNIRNQFGAEQVFLNGPRHWLMNQLGNNGGGLAFSNIHTFGSLQMGKAAQITGVLPSDFYMESPVERSTTYTFLAVSEIYKLINPDGEEYIMQSYSRKVNSNLSIDDLAGLGSILNPPSGWSYQVETLTSNLQVTANGIAQVIQDEFENSYQKIEN